MAAKKEKTKEQRIKSEKTRLKGIFKDLDENKRKLVTPLIEKAAFMSVELDDLQATSRAQTERATATSITAWITEKPLCSMCAVVLQSRQSTGQTQ